MGEGLKRAKRAAEQTRGQYPAWICSDCGRKHGRNSISVSTYHDGDSCGWCGEEKQTTEPRDWGYPPSPKEIRKKQKGIRHEIDIPRSNPEHER